MKHHNSYCGNFILTVLKNLSLLFAHLMALKHNLKFSMLGTRLRISSVTRQPEQKRKCSHESIHMRLAMVTKKDTNCSHSNNCHVHY